MPLRLADGQGLTAGWDGKDGAIVLRVLYIGRYSGTNKPRQVGIKILACPQSSLHAANMILTYIPKALPSYGIY